MIGLFCTVKQVEEADVYSLKFWMLIPQSHIFKFIVGIDVLFIMGNLKCFLKVWSRYMRMTYNFCNIRTLYLCRYTPERWNSFLYQLLLASITVACTFELQFMHLLILFGNVLHHTYDYWPSSEFSLNTYMFFGLNNWIGIFFLSRKRYLVNKGNQLL